MDKITIKYINYISQISSDICNESGKKTLNINHIIEALKKLGFESHIKLLQGELNLDVTEEVDDLKQDDMDEMKERINQKKRKKRDKKKNDIEFDEDLKREQMKLFEQSRIEAFKIMGQEGQLTSNTVTYCNKTILDDSFITGNTFVEEEENYD